jgi:hypothetical protein
VVLTAPTSIIGKTGCTGPIWGKSERMQGLIYTVDSDGELRRMTPSAPESEDRMQALVARYPELITDGDGDLLLIRREQAIADTDGASGRWSVDHLFVTREAVPVLVELKRAVDTRLRREVVGQMLDYAANATAYWQAGRVAESFARTVSASDRDPDEVLSDFIGDTEPATFWDQVDANFTAGRLKLVFVADEIPRELARVVEFLNDQMRADVRAVELRWFAGEGGAVTLSPRIIGETERTAVAKRTAPRPAPIQRDEWLAKHMLQSGDAAMAGAQAYIDLVEAAGGEAEVASQHGSIYAGFVGAGGRKFFPFHLWVDGRLVSLSLRWLKNRPALAHVAARQQWYDRLVEIVGPLSTSNLSGFPGFKVELLADKQVAAQVQTFLVDLVRHMREQNRPGSIESADGGA